MKAATKFLSEFLLLPCVFSSVFTTQVKDSVSSSTFERAARSLSESALRAGARASRTGQHTKIERVTSAYAEQRLPENHPILFTPWPAGLEEGCITYQDRYGAYIDSPSTHKHRWNPNEDIPEADITVLVRIHHNMQWSEDLKLFIRALMAECRESGLHFWLLHQDTTDEQSNGVSKPTDSSMDCPEEFRAILQTFTAKRLHDAYPLIHKYNAPHARDYITILTFLRRYKGYRFAWVIENDVRYTGRHWGAYLNTMLNIAVSSLSGRAVEQYVPELSALPLPDVHLADYILMSGNDIGFENPLREGYMPRDIENWRFANMFGGNAAFFGVSRLYIDTLHEHSIEGNGGYIEEFTLTLAVEEKLDIVSMPYAEWEGESFHCCHDFGTRYYEGWYISGQCRQFALIHPMKNSNESIWGKRENHFGG